jgi:hypothetical protein
MPLTERQLAYNEVIEEIARVHPSDDWMKVIAAIFKDNYDALKPVQDRQGLPDDYSHNLGGYEACRDYLKLNGGTI